MNMFRIATFMTGDDYEMLMADTPASRRKVVALSLAMMIPVSIWFVSGYLLASRVLKADTPSALMTAIGCATIVFLMEKLIVMSKGGKGLKIFRVLIGFVLAMLGSLAIEEVVFEKDINAMVMQLKGQQALEAANAAKADYEKLNGTAGYDDRIRMAETRYEEAEAAVIAEANGTYGTGRRGVGPITDLKERKARARRQELDLLYAQKQQWENERSVFADSARANALTIFESDGLLIRIKALARLVKSDTMMFISYLLFTLLMFSIEFLVVIFKSGWGTTNYERRVAMIDEVGERRMLFLMGEGNMLQDPAQWGQEFNPARRLARRTTSVFR
jgi:hypothetical protein